MMRKNHSKNTPLKHMTLILGSVICFVMIAGGIALYNHRAHEGTVLLAEPTAHPTNRPLPTPIRISVGANVSVVSMPTPTPPPATPISSPRPGQIILGCIQNTGKGDEAIVMENVGGSPVNVNGYSLSDTKGNRYLFQERYFFHNAEIRLHTRAGQETPLHWYWDLPSPVWTIGDGIILRDAQGEIIDAGVVQNGQGSCSMSLAAGMIIAQINDQGQQEERITLYNAGNTVELQGYTISGSKGQTYPFSERILFSGGQLILYTRVGKATPIKAYWGSDASLWEVGETITLKDPQGRIVATYLIGEDEG